MSHPIVPSLPANAVTLKDGRPVTTSLVVAETFRKQHQHVLGDIRKLDCSEEFARSNFGPSEYLNGQGKRQPLVEMTRDGMTFLVMGYTGPQAARFKEAYIAAFNRLERTAAPALVAELLRANPTWRTIQQCRSAGLSNYQIARVLGRNESTIRRVLQRMSACGLCGVSHG